MQWFDALQRTETIIQENANKEINKDFRGSTSTKCSFLVYLIPCRIRLWFEQKNKKPVLKLNLALALIDLRTTRL